MERGDEEALTLVCSSAERRKVKFGAGTVESPGLYPAAGYHPLSPCPEQRGQQAWRLLQQAAGLLGKERLEDVVTS